MYPVGANMGWSDNLYGFMLIDGRVLEDDIYGASEEAIMYYKSNKTKTIVTFKTDQENDIYLKSIGLNGLGMSPGQDSFIDRINSTFYRENNLFFPGTVSFRCFNNPSQFITGNTTKSIDVNCETDTCLKDKKLATFLLIPNKT